MWLLVEIENPSLLPPFFFNFLQKKKDLMLTLGIWPNSTPPIPPISSSFCHTLPPSPFLHLLCLVLFLQYTAAGNSTPSPPLCAVALATGTLKIGLSSLLLTFPVHNPTVSTDTMHLVTHSIDPLHNILHLYLHCLSEAALTNSFALPDTRRQLTHRKELDLTCVVQQSHFRCCSLCLPTLSWGCI